MVRFQAKLYCEAMSLGKNIVRARQDARLFNRSEFARRVGVSPQAAMQWENDETVPEGKHLRKIAEVCKTTVSKLMDEPGLSPDEQEWLKMLRLADPAKRGPALRAMKAFLTE